MVINRDITEATRLPLREGDTVYTPDRYHRGRVLNDETRDGFVTIAWDDAETRTMRAADVDPQPAIFDNRA